MRRLGIAHALLNLFDLVFDVTVGDENVQPAIIVVIEKEASESESHQCCPADFGSRGFVYKQTVTLIVIEREHLVGKVRDDDAGMSGAVIVGGINSHSCASHAVFTESD